MDGNQIRKQKIILNERSVFMAIDDRIQNLVTLSRWLPLLKITFSDEATWRNITRLVSHDRSSVSSRSSECPDRSRDDCAFSLTVIIMHAWISRRGKKGWSECLLSLPKMVYRDGDHRQDDDYDRRSHSHVIHLPEILYRMIRIVRSILFMSSWSRVMSLGMNFPHVLLFLLHPWIEILAILHRWFPNRIRMTWRWDRNVSFSQVVN